MYSYKDRIRVVELYIKLGQRVRSTIRQLGYPTKNALKGWYHEYQVRYAGREPKFSQEQKAAAIKHYLAQDRCVAGTARASGYLSRGTLTVCVRESLSEAKKAVVGSVG
jgi:transposase-like protein